jgi:hypothetical protein
MASLGNRLRTVLARLWTESPALTTAGLLMIGALAASIVGLVVDSRVIIGAPAWLKPAKFAVSNAIYMLTLAWIFTQLPEWPRTRRIAGWVTAVVLVLEVAIIDLQAWRGTTSHFNVGTPLDTVLFAIMGLAIALQTLSSVAVAAALWRQHVVDRALGWALRFGMVITIIGACTGAFMTRPTAAQLEEARATGRITIAGAHTVGAPDGGPGLPGTGWSVHHGDVRIPHFLGLHGMQILPLLALTLRQRRVAEIARVRMMLVATASYATLFAIVLWQALRGQSLVQPDSATIGALMGWAILTGLGTWFAATRRATTRNQAARGRAAIA